MNRADLERFAERARLAAEAALVEDPGGGSFGLEVELNILDGELHPVRRVGFGPERRSFADCMLEERLPAWARDRFQLEVFEWMVEAATAPYHDPRLAVAEARLLETVVNRALRDAELAFGAPLLALHGTIPGPVPATPEAIPGGWNLARKRYLSRCVELFGSDLATAGVHTNHSFPEPLVAWDYLHLPESERRARSLEAFRNEAVIRATRLLRPFCPLFIAVSAASPLAYVETGGEPRVVLAGADSMRWLTFPCPEELDPPGLYASHGEYLRLSYELVRSGRRFGANNWTPVRARSGVDPVHRNIRATAEQLRELYRMGLYADDEVSTLESAEKAILVEQLCARVDLPMQRVEVRTDEGGESQDLALAKLVFKQLLVLRHYADPEAGNGFGYGAGDLARTRRNEEAAARRGLDAEVEHPFGEGRVGIRPWLAAILEDLKPLAVILGWEGALEPLREMAGGGPNTAGLMRCWLRREAGGLERDREGREIVPVPLIRTWTEARRERLERESQELLQGLEGASEWAKIAPLKEGLYPGEARGGRGGAVRLGAGDAVRETLGSRVRDVIGLAVELIGIPSVTNCPEERLEEVGRCGRFIARWLRDAGLVVRLYDNGRYPAVLAALPGAPPAEVTLCGHFDVVKPEPDDRQLEPRIEGDWLWGRGAADMKTVVASFMVWMAERARRGQAPPINLLLVGNEENGEADPWGTPQVLDDLRRREGWEPGFMIVGERTGEKGQELVGKICPESRGIVRCRLIARGRRGHTGVAGASSDLLDTLIAARQSLGTLCARHLRLSSRDGWQSSARFPFLSVGEPGVYNVSAGEGELGLEIRPIPGEDLDAVLRGARKICSDLELELAVEVMEPGVVCPEDDPRLALLLEAVLEATGEPAVLGRKLPGSSARFAPGGRQVVWGQSGVGPHSAEERHFLPSIEPYLEIVDAFAERLTRR
ncbi:MAG: M20/M25/M40 family metallo-hydrolase [Acidobacteria bacterium]|nr:M20/M25/M40 family metallo-hydrolase [Acidobacteriota bacterium]